MTDLKPLRESSRDGFTKGLLESAFLDEPPRRSLRRTAAFLGVSEAAAAALVTSTASGAAPGILGAAGGTAVGTLSAGAAGGGKAALLVALKWLGAGAIVGATTAGSIDYFSTASPPSSTAAAPHAPVVAQGAATERAEPASVPATPEPASAALPSNPQEPKELPAARETAIKPRAPGVTASATPVTNAPSETPALDAEIRRLDRARAALLRKRPEGALAELAAYEAERKTTVLEREATVLRIDAMLARGDRESARALARRYVTDHPGDPHARRLRTLLESDGERR
jgi:hypothetical protein